MASQPDASEIYLPSSFMTMSPAATVAATVSTIYRVLCYAFLRVIPSPVLFYLISVFYPLHLAAWVLLSPQQVRSPTRSPSPSL